MGHLIPATYWNVYIGLLRYAAPLLIAKSPEAFAKNL